MTRLDWLKNKLKENNLDYKLIQTTCYGDYCSIFNTNVELKTFKDTVKNAYNTLIAQDKNKVDEEFDVENSLKLEKNLQKKSDINTYLKRNNRNEYRLLNYTESLYEELIKKLDDVKFDIPAIKEVKLNDKETKSAVLCLSDLHFGTLINSYNDSTGYDFTVISKRLKKYISSSIKIMKDNHVNTVYVANLGDIISSSRRSDEKLGTVSSQTNCILVAVTILEQIIYELCNNFNKVVFTGIVGNESRLEQDYFEYHAMNLQNNGDWLVLTMLKHILDGKIKNLSFIIPQNPMKNLLDIPINNGKDKYKFLIAHGNMIKSLKDSCEQVYTNEYIEEGIKVDCCAIGHFHHLSMFSNGRLVLCGTTMEDNAYAKAIGCVGKAFQNLFIINNDKTYWNIPVNLSDISDIKDEYKFDKELENCAYNRLTNVGVVNINISYN